MAAALICFACKRRIDPEEIVLGLHDHNQQFAQPAQQPIPPSTQSLVKGE